MKFFTIACAGLILAATSSLAQVYPEPVSTTVNDFADLIPPENEARIVAELEALAAKGTEMTVATLSSVQFYANDMDIAAYANGLFNTWGIGDAEKGDGVLLIVFRDDGILRIETGPFYDEDRQFAAQDVIGNVIVPAFQQQDFGGGIEQGVMALIPALTAPTQAPAAVASEESESGGNTLWYILGGIVVAIGGIFGLNKRAKAKLAATPCPACGKTGTLSKSSVVLIDATLEAAGEGERRTTCSDCGNIDASKYVISQLKPDEDPKFSGGKSEGGGATGKW